MLLTLVGAGCGGDGTKSQTATLHIITGIVEVENAGSIGPAADGQEVRAGDTVHTGFDGRAEIQYFDGSVTRLDFNTVFSIDTLDADGEVTVIVGRHLSGNTYHRVVAFTESGSRFEVATPSAIASVQGTEYALLLDEQNITTVVVFDQAVEVASSGGAATVGAGFSLSVGPPQAALLPIGEPEAISQELLEDDWIVFNTEG